MKTKLKSALTTVVKIAITASLLWWLLRSGKLNLSLIAQLRDPLTIASGFVLIYIGIFVNNFRWQLLLLGQHVPVTFRQTLALSHIGLFFNFTMPGGVGGDVFKGYYLVQDFPDRRLVVATSVLVDRLIGFYVMTALGVAALLCDLEAIKTRPAVASLMFVILSLFLAFTCFFTVALSKRLSHLMKLHAWIPRLPGGHFVLKIYDTVHRYRNDLRGFWIACTLSVVSQSTTVLFFIVLGRALGGTEIPWQVYAVVVPLGLIATSMPISIAGIGVGQTVFAQLFLWNLGYETPVAAALMTVYQMVLFVFGLTGIIFYLQRGRPNPPAQIAPA